MVRIAGPGLVRIWVALVIALLTSSIVGAQAGAAPTNAAVAGARSPDVVVRRACPDSEFTCITLRVPLDHFAPPGGPTTAVTFGLLRASSGHRRGVFVTATGGPGTSGLSVADSYTSALDPRIAEEYNIVFFDQRGIGLSGPIQCAEAVLDFQTTPAVPTVSHASARAYARAARAFSADCVDEMEIQRARLASYATARRSRISRPFAPGSGRTSCTSMARATGRSTRRRTHRPIRIALRRSSSTGRWTSR